MKPLPVLISVPHAGLEVPEELRDLCALSHTQIAEDGDGGAAEIYFPLRHQVAAFITSPVARAFVDLNRAEDDLRTDGVVKTETCWQVPVYREALGEELIEDLLQRYHRPYHGELDKLAQGVRLGIDCHTMAASAPPIGPDSGKRRPRICLGSGRGSCPLEWVGSMADELRDAFDQPVSIDLPFSGGHITRSRPGGIPWLQIELSREPWVSDRTKGILLLTALRCFCTRMDW